MSRAYKGVTVEMWLHLDGKRTQYSLNGMVTVRGQRGSLSFRGAWKAAKSEINRNRKG
jgi:hypothetical protein